MMRDAIHGARLVTIPGAAHLSNYEQPQAFDTAIREFKAGTTADSAVVFRELSPTTGSGGAGFMLSPRNWTIGEGC